MAARVDEDTKLLELLNRHPELKQRVRALADIAEDTDGDLVRADEAERRVIEEVRRIGQETLHSWAEGRIARGEEEHLQAEGVRRAGKKNSAGTPRSEPSRSRSRSIVREPRSVAPSRGRRR